MENFVLNAGEITLLIKEVSLFAKRKYNPTEVKLWDYYQKISELPSENILDESEKNEILNLYEQVKITKQEYKDYYDRLATDDEGDDYGGDGKR